jgi:hypothetical protein
VGVRGCSGAGVQWRNGGEARGFDGENWRGGDLGTRRLRDEDRIFFDPGGHSRQPKG